MPAKSNRWVGMYSHPNEAPRSARHSRFGVHLCLLTLLLFFFGCSGKVSNTTAGAVTGTAIGSGLGAIIGSATGRAGAGTAIGAGVGAVTGVLMGGWLDQGDRANEERRREAERTEAEIVENRRLMESLRQVGVDATLSDRGVRINLPDVLFGFNRSDLGVEANQLVGEISGILRDKAQGREVMVEGHTDSVGSEEYNKSLSERRADTVARTLISSGVNNRLVRSKGFGENRPIASNDTESGRQRNRRVEIVVSR